MASRCAACEQPIEKRQPFVLAGTEVFHRACAPNIRNSVRTRLELKTIELQQRVSNANNATARALIERDEARRQLADERERTREAIRTREQKDGELQVARAARDAVNRDAAYYRGIMNERDAEIARLRAEGDKLRADLVKARAESGSPATAAAKDERDPSEVRFSLLEIDK